MHTNKIVSDLASEKRPLGLNHSPVFTPQWLGINIEHVKICSKRLKEWMTIKGMSDGIWTSVFCSITDDVDGRIFSLHEIRHGDACH